MMAAYWFTVSRMVPGANVATVPAKATPAVAWIEAAVIVSVGIGGGAAASTYSPRCASVTVSVPPSASTTSRTGSWLIHALPSTRTVRVSKDPYSGGSDLLVAEGDRWREARQIARTRGRRWPRRRR
jgi:hypothetical protein